MAYSNPNRPLDTPAGYQVNNPVVVVKDRVHWGAIIAGLVIAISSQLLLSSLGAALGFSNIAGSDAPRTNSGSVAQAVGIWSIISLFISLFIGGWVTARAYGSINRSTAILNGAVLWATTLTISAWLLASGVSGTFGLVVANAGNIINQTQQSGISIPDRTTTQAPNLSAQQTREVAGSGAKGAWGFSLGTLLGLAASTLGASAGARRIHPRTTITTEV